jgi:hypothetical protein
MRYSFLSVGLLFIFFSCVYHDLEIKKPVEIPQQFDCDAQFISWQNDILPIMVRECATVTCHDGITRLDWRNYALVKQYASSIKTLTQNRSMPFDDVLPQEEIDKIVCWVDKGALNN